jgi:predicted MFS family arabinose efflux permease
LNDHPGIFTQYLSWRIFHAALGVCGMIQVLLLFVFLPETAHPGTRGIDKIQGQKKAFVWINPFRCLAFLRSPNIIVVVSQLYHVGDSDHTMT